MTEASTSSPPSASRKPLLFVSHRHVDKAIADVVRQFITDRSGGRISIFQSSSSQAQGPRVGQDLRRELKEALWKAGVIILIYTTPDEDWSFCMWECGVATHPQSPETKVIVFQCGPRAPVVYDDAVRVDLRNATDIQRFTNEFLTSADFFPGYGEAVAPGFSPNGDEVRHAATQLGEALRPLIDEDSDEGEDWSTIPFLRLQLTYTEVDSIRGLDEAQGARSVHETARVTSINDGAKRLFGIGRVQPSDPFSQLVSAWQQRRRNESAGWLEDLLEQVRVGSHWLVPRFQWKLMKSVDDTDSAKYAPILTRIRSVPRQRCHEFDIYFSKFATNEEGAIQISSGFS